MTGQVLPSSVPGLLGAFVSWAFAVAAMQSTAQLSSTRGKRGVLTDLSWFCGTNDQAPRLNRHKHCCGPAMIHPMHCGTIIHAQKA